MTRIYLINSKSYFILVYLKFAKEGTQVLILIKTFSPEGICIFAL